MIHRPLPCGDGGHGNRQALVGKVIHHLEEAFAFGGAEETRGRDVHVVEEKFGNVLAVSAQLFQRAPRAESGEAVRLDEDERDTLWGRLPSGQSSARGR